MVQSKMSITKSIRGSKKVSSLTYSEIKLFEGTIEDLKEVLKDIFPFGGSASQTLKYLDEVIQESINIINKHFKKLGETNYTILEYKEVINWKVKNPKFIWDNNARLIDGVLEFDFNTFGLKTKGLGKKWVDEAFDIFDDKIKKVKTVWTENPNYPKGKSLGCLLYTSPSPRD